MLSHKNVKMKPKLIGLFLLVGVIPLALVGFWSAIQSTKSLMDQSFNQLTAIREIKKIQIEKYFAEREGDMGDALVPADNPFVHQAFKALDAAFEAAGGAIGGRYKVHTSEKYDAPAS